MNSNGNRTFAKRAFLCVSLLALLIPAVTPTAAAIPGNSIDTMCDAVGTRCAAAIALAGNACVTARATIRFFPDADVRACTSTAQAAAAGNVLWVGLGKVDASATVRQKSGNFVVKSVTRDAHCTASILAWRGCGTIAGLTVSGSPCLEGSATAYATNGGGVSVAHASSSTGCSQNALSRFIGILAPFTFAGPRVPGADGVPQAANTSEEERREPIVADLSELAPEDRDALLGALQADLQRQFDEQTAGWENTPGLVALKADLHQQVFDGFKNAQGTVLLIPQ